MKLQTTKVFDKIIENIETNRYFILYGGSSSSKTISILQYLTLYAFKYKNKRITLSAESVPVLKKTLIQDWRDIIMQDMFVRKSWNATDLVYTFPNGSIFQFIPADDDRRWHGLRQDIVYFDEIYNIKESIYNQADIRTKEKVFCSFNPTSQFWLQNHFNDDKTVVIHSTYKDNQFVSPEIIDALEKRIKVDKNFYDVYVLGKFGNLEGLIFKENENWFITDKRPKDYKKHIIGLDFGFSVDPTAIVDVFYSDGKIFVDELLYSRNKTNPQLKPFLYDNHKVAADSAEPKSIKELKDLGCNIVPAMKGHDSIKNGIKRLLNFNIYITKSSVNVIKEFRNYKWDTDKEGNQKVKPIDNWNHAIDAIRYAVYEMFNEKNIFFI